MGTLNEKIQYLSQTKGLIKEAIIAKGQSISDSDTFRSYVDKISAIDTVNNQNKTILANGTYTADEGYTGLGEVVVDVGGVPINNQNKTADEDGLYTADEGYTGLGMVTVTAGAVATERTENYIAEELMLINQGEVELTVTVTPSNAEFVLISVPNSVNLVPTSSSGGVYTFNISAIAVEYMYAASATGYVTDTGTIVGGTTSYSITLEQE